MKKFILSTMLLTTTQVFAQVDIVANPQIRNVVAEVKCNKAKNMFFAEHFRKELEDDQKSRSQIEKKIDVPAIQQKIRDQVYQNCTPTDPFYGYFPLVNTMDIWEDECRKISNTKLSGVCYKVGQSFMGELLEYTYAVDETVKALAKKPE